MRSLEATSQKIVELRATFKECRAIVSVLKASIVTNALSEIKLREHVPIVSVLETPIVSTLISTIKQGGQLPLVSVVEEPTVQTTGNVFIGEAKLVEQVPLAFVVETPIVQVIDDALISETKQEEQLPLLSSMKISPSDALMSEIKLNKPLLSTVERRTVKIGGDVNISEIRLEEKIPVVESPISGMTSTSIDSQVRFDREVEIKAAGKAGFDKCMPVAKTHTVRAPIIDIKLEEQSPVVSIVEAPMVQVIGDALMSETKLGKQDPIVSVVEKHTVSGLLSEIKLEEQLPVVSVFEAPIGEVAVISEIKLAEQLPLISTIRTLDVQVTSTPNSKARLEERSLAVGLVGTPLVQVTDAPIRHTTLQRRLSFILKNLPPASQFPRFTKADIKATAVRFEQAIINLVALSNRIAETAGGRIRAASVVRYSPPQSPVSLRHSIFTHSDSDESEYEDNDENDCSVTPQLEDYDSERESEQSDIEDDKPFPKFESKKARLMREKREALAATLTDDMLFNLLLVDCTTKPKLPDNAPIITRKRISKVPRPC